MLFEGVPPVSEQTSSHLGIGPCCGTFWSQAAGQTSLCFPGKEHLRLCLKSEIVAQGNLVLVIEEEHGKISSWMSACRLVRSEKPTLILEAVLTLRAILLSLKQNLLYVTNQDFRRKNHHGVFGGQYPKGDKYLKGDKTVDPTDFHWYFFFLILLRDLCKKRALFVCE